MSERRLTVTPEAMAVAGNGQESAGFCPVYAMELQSFVRRGVIGVSATESALHSS